MKLDKAPKGMNIQDDLIKFKDNLSRKYPDSYPNIDILINTTIETKLGALSFGDAGIFLYDYTLEHNTLGEITELIGYIPYHRIKIFEVAELGAKEDNSLHTLHISKKIVESYLGALELFNKNRKTLTAKEGKITLTDHDYLYLLSDLQMILNIIADVLQGK